MEVADMTTLEIACNADWNSKPRNQFWRLNLSIEELEDMYEQRSI